MGPVTQPVQMAAENHMSVKYEAYPLQQEKPCHLLRNQKVISTGSGMLLIKTMSVCAI